MTTLEQIARTIALARHGTDAMWANYLTAAEAVEKMMSEKDYDWVSDATRYAMSQSEGASHMTEAPETSETPSGHLRLYAASKGDFARLQSLWYITTYRGTEVEQTTEWRDVPVVSE